MIPYSEINIDQVTRKQKVNHLNLLLVVHNFV